MAHFLFLFLSQNEHLFCIHHWLFILILLLIIIIIIIIILLRFTSFSTSSVDQSGNVAINTHTQDLLWSSQPHKSRTLPYAAFLSAFDPPRKPKRSSATLEPPSFPPSRFYALESPSLGFASSPSFWSVFFSLKMRSPWGTSPIIICADRLVFNVIWSHYHRYTLHLHPRPRRHNLPPLRLDPAWTFIDCEFVIIEFLCISKEKYILWKGEKKASSDWLGKLSPFAEAFSGLVSKARYPEPIPLRSKPGRFFLRYLLWFAAFACFSA